MPDYETGVKVISLKYLIDINVKTRSFIFETLAFSKGDIFIDIILPKFSHLVPVYSRAMGRMKV